MMCRDRNSRHAYIPFCTGRFPRQVIAPRPWWKSAAAEKDRADLVPFARDRKLAMVEAALFAAEEPLSAKRLATAAMLPQVKLVRPLVQRLRDLFDQEGSSFQVVELAGGYQLLTRPEYSSWLSRVAKSGEEVRMSTAARETLAIVAYKQPIMRAELEAIRGVQGGDTIRWLMEHNLVRIVGRHDSLGRPVLFGTSKRFLQIYGLNSIQDLPALE